MKQRTSSVLAWSLAVATVVLSVWGFYFAAISLHVRLPSQYFGPRANSGFLALAFAGMGFLLARKRPSNPIGWIALVGAALGGVQTLADGYAIWAVSGQGSQALLARMAAVGEDYIWMAPFAMIGVVFVIFPNGRPISRRWGWWMWTCIAGTAITIVGYALSAHPLIYRNVDNPLAVRGAYQIGNFATISFFVLLILGLASLVVRLRRSAGDEHEQMKWLAFSSGLVVAGFFLYFLSYALSGGNGGAPVPNFFETMILLAVISIPVTIGIGILKYRLYDIDVVISRTVVFGVLAAFITLVYVGIVAGVGALLGRGDKPNVALSIAATAIVAVAFQPVRARVQRFANRLVYGRRATPYEVMSGFSHRIAGTVSLDELLPQMAEAAAQGVGASAGRVRLFLPDGGERIVTRPDENGHARTFDHVIAVDHQGAIVGEIAVAKPSGEALTPAEVKLLDNLAAQAGLAMHNARLTVELQARVEEISRRSDEIRGSRQRIVAARDAALRQLERDINGGTQQQLLAISARIRSAADLMEHDPSAAGAMLDELGIEANDALEALRDLARGIFPPLLADKGLVAALQAHINKARLPATLQTQGIIERYNSSVEAAVYLCCIEAMQNASKYATDAVITATLSAERNSLSFSVADDGLGFDPAVVKHRSGLQQMADRVEALEGTLDVISSPGNGTTISGLIPIRSKQPTE